MLDGVVMEVSVIEVSREWRSVGLAGKLLSLLMDHPRIEDRIIYMVGYSWTWDLDGLGRTAMEYRNILVKLFERFQFKPYVTNEANVCLRPEWLTSNPVVMYVQFTIPGYRRITLFT